MPHLESPDRMVLPNERWAWLDGWGTGRDSAVESYLAYGDCWFLVRQQEMLGPYPGDQILRMRRIASCLCVDGCQLGPPGLGWNAVGKPRPCRKEPHWTLKLETELPLSITRYQPSGLEPVGCCCSNFDSWPQLGGGQPLWHLFCSEEPPLWGSLQQTWNVHPPGSLVLTQEPMESGMTIIDWPLQVPV